MSAIDKRLYYLMLSPSLGQDFASDVGFSSPSEEVQEAETTEIIARWALMTSAGLLGEILQCSDWFCELKELHELPETMRADFHRTLVSHGVGLVNRLLDSEKILMVMEIDEEYEDD